jgi:threonine/homoserine/homoserine lactone efflux protein
MCHDGRFLIPHADVIVYANDARTDESKMDLAGINGVATGFGLGLFAGIAPGPMLALVVAYTLRHGALAGACAAFAPLVSDAPVVIAALSVLWIATDAVSANSWLEISLGLIGGLYLIWLGVRGLGEYNAGAEAAAPGSPGSGWRFLGEAVCVNWFNPHPWLFWFSVGAPLIMRHHRSEGSSAWGLLAAFYAALVGAKLVMVGVISVTRKRIGPALQSGLVTVAYAGLVVIGVVFIVDAFTRLS